MKRTLRALEARKTELQARAEQERAQLALHFEPFEKPLSWVDKGIDALNVIKSSPIIWSGAFALLAHYQPKLASKALAVGWGAMKLFKGAKSLLSF